MMATAKEESTAVMSQRDWSCTQSKDQSKSPIVYQTNTAETISLPLIEGVEIQSTQINFQ